jgi:hypothetical protein
MKRRIFVGTEWKEGCLSNSVCGFATGPPRTSKSVILWAALQLREIVIPRIKIWFGQLTGSFACALSNDLVVTTAGICRGHPGVQVVLPGGTKPKE